MVETLVFPATFVQQPIPSPWPRCASQRSAAAIEHLPPCDRNQSRLLFVQAKQLLKYKSRRGRVPLFMHDRQSKMDGCDVVPAFAPPVGNSLLKIAFPDVPFGTNPFCEPFSLLIEQLAQSLQVALAKQRVRYLERVFRVERDPVQRFGFPVNPVALDKLQAVTCAGIDSRQYVVRSVVEFCVAIFPHAGATGGKWRTEPQLRHGSVGIPCKHARVGECRLYERHDFPKPESSCCISNGVMEPAKRRGAVYHRCAAAKGLGGCQFRISFGACRSAVNVVGEGPFPAVLRPFARVRCVRMS